MFDWFLFEFKRFEFETLIPILIHPNRLACEGLLFVRQKEGLPPFFLVLFTFLWPFFGLGLDVDQIS